jgi:hypothetical protein
MSKSNKCQSCGMPLSKDENGGGTNKDGTKNSKYCSHCYNNGEFTNPDISVEEMQELVNNKMKEMHIPKFMARMFTKGIPKLERWN